MTATEELRRLLDERGVEYRWDNGTATWYVDGVMYNAWGYDNERLTMSVCHLTPEQAITATVGRGTCKNTAPIYLDFLCSECGFVYYRNDENFIVGGNDWHYCPNCGAKVVSA